MESNQQRKKILVFIDWFLPGYKAGGPVRSMANMVDHLSNQFDFYIVTRNTEYLETTPYSGIESNQWVDFQTGVKVYYASVDKEGFRLWKQLIKTGNFDAVYINGIYSLKYSLLPLLAAKKNNVSRIIVAPRGMLGAGAIQLKSFKKNLFLSISKKIRLFGNVVWHATAESEKNEIINNYKPDTDIHVIPNLYREVNHENKIVGITKEVRELKVCFISRVSRKKNLLFAIQSLMLTENSNQIAFDIYGPLEDLQYWEECKNLIAELPANVTVKYCGVIESDKVIDQLRQYHALLFPTLHENFGHVILECLMAGRPVLISDQTPWLNLVQRQAGWDLPLGNIAQFTVVVNELAQMNLMQYVQWAKGALLLANEFVSDPIPVQQYLNLFQ